MEPKRAVACFLLTFSLTACQRVPAGNPDEGQLRANSAPIIKLERQLAEARRDQRLQELVRFDLDREKRLNAELRADLAQAEIDLRAAEADLRQERRAAARDSLLRSLR